MNKIATITTKKTITLEKIFDDFEGNFLFLILCLINYICASYQSYEMNKPKYPNYCMDNHKCYELIDSLKDGLVFSQWVNIGFICLNILWIVIGSGIIRCCPKYLHELAKSSDRNKYLLMCIGWIYMTITKLGILSLGFPDDSEFESTKFPLGISNPIFIRILYFITTLIPTLFLLWGVFMSGVSIIADYIYEKFPTSIKEFYTKITNEITQIKNEITNKIKNFHSNNYHIVNSFLWIGFCVVNYVWTSSVIDTMNSPKYINHCVEDNVCYEFIELLKNKFVFSRYVLLLEIVVCILYIGIELGFKKYIPKSFNKYNKNIIILLIILYISITNHYILFSEQFQEIKPTWIFPVGLYNLSFIIFIILFAEVLSIIIIFYVFWSVTIFCIYQIYENSGKIKFEITEDKQFVVDKLV
jgi:hypothetical protein